ncbi:MAG: hypothetical protein GXZ18_06680 [Synergistaceae bacterium]|nr:hypothetical protein [Synergistaceae bacterium]
MKEMRPTTGRVLLALFNILGPLDGKSFLDLFSGSGQITLEAKKRGAENICSIESDRKRYEAIVKKVPKDVKCFCMDVRRAVSRFAKKGESFNIIFADPPYDLGWGQELPKLIDNNNFVLSDNGIFVYEHSEREEIFELDLNKWSREDRVYGGTILTFYKKEI